MIETTEPAVASSKHHRHTSERDSSLDAVTITFRVLYINVDSTGICEISDSAFLRHQVMAFAVLFNLWEPDVDVCKLQEEGGVRLGCDQLVCLDDLLNPHIHEVVERVDMLLD